MPTEFTDGCNADWMLLRDKQAIKDRQVNEDSSLRSIIAIVIAINKKAPALNGGFQFGVIL